MGDDDFELRWRKQGYTSDEVSRIDSRLPGPGKLRRRLTRATARGKAALTAKSKRAGTASPGQTGTVDPHKTKRAGTATRASDASEAYGGRRSIGLAGRRQRCVVKVNYIRHARNGAAGGGARGAAPLSAHARYLERDGAGASDPFGQGYLTRHGQAMFGADGKRLEEWQGDRHHFRLVISPEHADRLDLRAFTTSFMQELELKLYQSRSASAPLEWVAVTHHNTDHPHAHVVLRGKIQDGRDLVIPKKTIAHGLRELARDLATRELGYRPRHEIVRDLERQVGQERFTDLDRSILSQARSVGKEHRIDRAVLDDHQRARVDWLVGQGYASRHSNDDALVVIPAGLEERLSARGEERDIVRSLQRSGRFSASDDGNHPPLRHYRGSIDGAPLVGRVEHVEPMDELSDRFGAVVRDAGDERWLFRISHGQAERLAVGDDVRISTTRTLPSGKTTRAPFIRIETLKPSPSIDVPASDLLKIVGRGVAEEASTKGGRPLNDGDPDRPGRHGEERSRDRGMDID